MITVLLTVFNTYYGFVPNRLNTPKVWASAFCADLVSVVGLVVWGAHLG